MMFPRNKWLAILGGNALVCALAFGATASAHAAIIKVAATGGTTATTRDGAIAPGGYFRSLQAAINATISGDKVDVSSGVYNIDGNVSGSLSIRSKSNITVEAAPGSITKPKITVTNNNYVIVKISEAQNIVFDGFEVDGTGGGNDCIGVAIIPENLATIVASKNITIRNCKVHHCSGGGIVSAQDQATKTVGNDYIYIQKNEIYSCLNNGGIQGSAISLLHNTNSDTPGNTNDSYHNKIENNNIHDNINNNANAALHTDGNGIIIDTTGRTPPKTIVQNNLVYRNGGRGIHIFNSSNVDVFNNSLYHNNLDTKLIPPRGELTACSCDNVFFSNNVVQGIGGAIPSFRLYSLYADPSNSNVRFNYNTWVGGDAVPNDNPTDAAKTQAALVGRTNIFSAPSLGMFVNPEANNLRLVTLSGVPQTALNNGTNVGGDFSAFDIDGVPRKPIGGSPGGSVDRGAYER